MIFEPDGGNQGPYKGVLMFLARKLRAAPDYGMTAQERKEYEEVRAWWMTNRPATARNIRRWSP